MDIAKSHNSFVSANSNGADFSAAMSISDFCQRYSIGRTMAYEEHRRGRLAFRKVGARSIILASEAERWAASLPEAKA